MPTLQPTVPSIAAALGPYCETKNSALSNPGNTGPAQTDLTNPLNMQEVFHCPGDPEPSYFTAQGLSYDYPSIKFQGKTRIQACMMSVNGNLQPVSSTLVPILYDFGTFHGDPNSGVSRNFLYADGHTADQ
jgi:prepilin-type processing-associated H-X9-DG protein